MRNESLTIVAMLLLGLGMLLLVPAQGRAANVQLDKGQYAPQSPAGKGPMLSEEEKRKIRLEEEYRLEVRSMLETKGGGKTVFSTLNQPIVVWFLSSVILGGITFAYARLQHRFEVSRQERATIVKIVTEITDRGDQFSGPWLDRYSTDQGLKWAGALSPLRDPMIIGGMAGPPVFPEFSGRTVRSLIVELRSRCQGSKATSELLETLTAIQNLQGEPRPTCVAEARRLTKMMTSNLATISDGCSH